MKGPLREVISNLNGEKYDRIYYILKGRTRVGKNYREIYSSLLSPLEMHVCMLEVVNFSQVISLLCLL